MNPSSTSESKDTFGERVLQFYADLCPPKNLPKEIRPILPYEGAQTREGMRRFFDKFFSDTRPRVFVVGINPGRFGSGVTGIPFTDPIVLEEACGMPNTFPKRKETTSQFLYAVIQKWGGVQDFYSRFFLAAVSPIGFTRDGKNYNYYDDREFLECIRPFLAQKLTEQCSFGAHKNAAIVLGSGKNEKVFSRLNEELQLFNTTYTLPHPRYIMQYKRKRMDVFVEEYIETLKKASDACFGFNGE